MKTINLKPEINVTVHNEQTGKMAKIKVNDSFNVLENKSKSLALLGLIEMALETKLNPIWDKLGGFSITLKEDQILCFLGMLKVFFNATCIHDEKGAIYYKNDDVVFKVIENLESII